MRPAEGVPLPLTAPAAPLPTCLLDAVARPVGGADIPPVRVAVEAGLDAGLVPARLPRPKAVDLSTVDAVALLAVRRPSRPRDAAVPPVGPCRP